MNYSEFKAYLATFLWKDTDAILVANLDNLILMGEASLNRELRSERRHKEAELSLTESTGLVLPLPTDYWSIRSIAFTERPGVHLKYVGPSELRAANALRSQGVWLDQYSIVDKQIMFAGPLSTTPKLATISYRAKVPNFAQTDTSWLADDMLDLLTYAVLKHSSMFLREDERLQQWAALYQQPIDAMNEQSAFEQERGISTHMPLATPASVHRRGDRRF